MTTAYFIFDFDTASCTVSGVGLQAMAENLLILPRNLTGRRTDANA